MVVRVLELNFHFGCKWIEIFTYCITTSPTPFPPALRSLWGLNKQHDACFTISWRQNVFSSNLIIHHVKPKLPPPTPSNSTYPILASTPGECTVYMIPPKNLISFSWTSKFMHICSSRVFRPQLLRNFSIYSILNFKN